MDKKLPNNMLVLGIFFILVGTGIVSSSFNIKSEKVIDDPPYIIHTSEPWWDYDWSARKMITIYQGLANVDLFNFTVLMKNTSESFSKLAQNDGDDFVFIDNTQTKLNHEIEYYNESSGELIAWLNIPYLSTSEDTILWLYYGNENCQSQENIEETWDENYLGVYHLNEEFGNFCIDSKGDNNGLYHDGLPRPISVMIGYGQEFDGNGDYISFPSDCHIDTSGTVEIWIKQLGFDTVNLYYIDFGGIGNFNQMLGYYTNRYNFNGKYGGINQWDIYEPEPLVDSNLHYIAQAFDMNNVVGWRDSIFIAHDSSTPGISSYPFNIFYVGATADLNWYFLGHMDEIRISSIRRSDEWLSTSYKSMRYPFLYVYFGEQELRNLPNVDFSYEPDNPTLDTDIQFTDLSYDNIGIINRWWWDFGDNFYSDLQNPQHRYYKIGDYNVTLKVWNDVGGYNSTTKLISIYESNTPPGIPEIDGETQGVVDVEYEYTFISTDPEGEDVYYWIIWGDGCPAVEWSGPYVSGEEVVFTHTFASQGMFSIRAKAKDIHDSESDWGYLDVTMPLDYSINNYTFNKGS